MKLQRILLCLVGGFFAIYGLAFSLFPEVLSNLVTNTVPNSSSGLIDMRSTYGGMSMAFGIIMLMMSNDQIHLTLGTKSIILVMAGMASNRLLGFILDGNPNWVMYLYLALEIFVIFLSLFALRKANNN